MPINEFAFGWSKINFQAIVHDIAYGYQEGGKAVGMALHVEFFFQEFLCSYEVIVPGIVNFYIRNMYEYYHITDNSVELRTN